MNLPLFLNKTDTLTAKLSHEDLEGFIHEVARTLPESQRDDFLGLLESFTGQGASRKAGKDEGYEALRTEIEAVKEKLDEINKGKWHLDRKYYMGRNKWYDGSGYAYFFSDPEEILDDISEAIKLVHRCVDMGAYNEGRELAEILSFLEVTEMDTYSGWTETSLYMNDLCKHDLLFCDFETVVKECLYLTYMGYDLEERPEKILYVIDNFGCYDVSLENILQMGNGELPEFDEFLVRWISYLGRMKDYHVRDFLKEAQAMLPDEGVRLENARKYVEYHSELYEEIFRMKLESDDNEKMLEIGREVLDKISYTYTVRGGIALLTAEYACKLQNKDVREACWQEAFRSTSTVMNYLRIRMQTENWVKYKDDVRTIYVQFYE